MKKFVLMLTTVHHRHLIMRFLLIGVLRYTHMYAVRWLY